MQLVGLLSLNVRDNKITSLPTNIGELTELRDFDLSKNQLAYLPLSMGLMTGLHRLNVDENPFESPPMEIVHKGREPILEYLRSLSHGSSSSDIDLRDQGLERVPVHVMQFNTMTKLVLDNNELIELPENLGILTHLRVFSFVNNKITLMPDSVGMLEQLTDLRCDKNQLTQIPQTVGDLKHLERLSLRANDLQDLPKEIGNLKMLQEFDIRENPNLHILPMELGRIDHLKTFWFDIEPITFPQQDVVLEGPRYVLKFLHVLYDASKTGKLDLSSADYNLQSLHIPEDRFTNLTELNLARNCFSEIPEYLLRFTDLRVLEDRRQRLVGQALVVVLALEALIDLAQLRHDMTPRSMRMIIVFADLAPKHPLVLNLEDTCDFLDVYAAAAACAHHAAQAGIQIVEEARDRMVEVALLREQRQKDTMQRAVQPVDGLLGRRRDLHHALHVFRCDAGGTDVGEADHRLGFH